MEWLIASYCLAASLLFFTLIFFIARKQDRYDVIDSAWGIGFISIALVGYLSQATVALFSVQSLVLLLVIIWGMRLSLHIYSRWAHAGKEDRRYAALRQEYGESVIGLEANMYSRVYLVQAILAWVISLPVIAVTVADVITLSWYAWVGLGVWLVGFYFEVVGDAQLRAFTGNPNNKGMLMTRGLWRYTRHPNYFGEATQWWGVFIIALIVPFGWITVIGPITLTVLLLFISGVPLTEKHFHNRLGWKAYKRRTSRFIPLPPRR